MRVHTHPPLPLVQLAPPPKPAPTAFQLEMQAEELTRTAQQHQTSLKKLYGARKDRPDLDEDTDSEKDNRDRRPSRNLDLLA